jgi:hypothetical protein
MRRFVRQCVVIVGTVVFSSSVLAQVLIDVKTKFSEKKELHFLKLALMTSLDTTGWARTSEIGEHFSVWLKNYRSWGSGDSICSECDLEIHPPSLLTEGECLNASHLLVGFDTSGLAPNLEPTDSVVAALMVKNLLDSSMLSKFLNAIGVHPARVAAHPVVNYLARQFVIDFTQLFNRRPTAVEMIEASLLSARALLAVRTYVAERYPQVFHR